LENTKVCQKVPVAIKTDHEATVTLGSHLKQKCRATKPN